MDCEKWYTSLLLTQCEELLAFEVQKSCQLHVDFKFQLYVDHVCIVLGCKKSNYGEALAVPSQPTSVKTYRWYRIRIGNQRN